MGGCTRCGFESRRSGPRPKGEETANPAEGKEIFKQKALLAYDKYMELQASIDSIEEQAIRSYRSIDVAEYQLKHADQYAHYRRLCVNRDIKMRVASLNAQMALL